MKTQKLMILLEGNIGAGKTTVGKAIAASGLYGFIEEPTRAWREQFASNMLENLYCDPARWAFTFQICTFITRAKSWPEIAALTNHSRVILERSIFCDRFVFVENFYRTGLEPIRKTVQAASLCRLYRRIGMRRLLSYRLNDTNRIPALLRHVGVYDLTLPGPARHDNLSTHTI